MPAFYFRITRGQMLETLGDDFVRTTQAKGLPARHRDAAPGAAFPADLSPLVRPQRGSTFAGLLDGTIITEGIYALSRDQDRCSIHSVFNFSLPVSVGLTLVADTYIVVAEASSST